MSIPKIKIESDFSDFYDFLGVSSEQLGVFNRFRSSMPDKAEGLAQLRSIGVQTIDTTAARRAVSASGKLVVYTDQSKHDGTGRVLMTMDEANMIYPNSLASEFFEEADCITNKLLQVGSRRFRIVLRGKRQSLKAGEVVQLSEITPSFNMLLGLPIYSIDYVSTPRGLLAITLNTVERLADYGLQEVIKPEDVINEVYNALLKYNRI